MIQRVQSIFMFIAAVSMILTLFFPLWGKAGLQSEGENEKEYALMTVFELRYELRNDAGESRLLGTQNTFLLSIGVIAAVLTMFYSISRFKNRMLQVKLNALFSMLTASTLVGAVYYTLKANQLFDPELMGNYLPGFYLPIIAMFNNFLANRFIRKDEALVRSADRIR